MDLVTALAGIALLVAGMIAFAWHVFGRASDHLAGMYRSPALEWPHGVQEDDPPPAWSWRRGSAEVTPESDGLRRDDVPARTAVSPHLRRGSSRRGGGW
ncbi:MAG TPA: hypothetical protein VGC90_02610 [Candidatus Limnocylindrales bacterium]